MRRRKANRKIDTKGARQQASKLSIRTNVSILFTIRKKAILSFISSFCFWSHEKKEGPISRMKLMSPCHSTHVRKPFPWRRTFKSMTYRHAGYQQKRAHTLQLLFVNDYTTAVCSKILRTCMKAMSAHL